MLSKVLGTLVDVRQYSKKYLTNQTTCAESVFAGSVENHATDDLDLKLLTILANDARCSLTELARKTKSTVDIIRTKMKRLEKTSIILGYRLSLDLNKLGLEFFKAIIYVRTLSKKDEQALFSWVHDHPNSVYYIRTITPWDLEFEFVVENYQQFNKIINDLRKQFPKVIRNYEHIIMIEETFLPGLRILK